MHKIMAVTRFNQGEAIVLEKPIQLTYTKYGRSTIIGTDGVFVSCYSRSNDGYDKAFGGRKFDLELSDGTVEHCSGQWWDSVSNQARKEIDGEIISATVKDIVSLRECFVFIGYSAIKEKYEELRATYTGEVYKYREYKELIKDTMEEKVLKKVW